MEDLYRSVREAFFEMYDATDVLGSFRDEIVQQLSEEGKGKLPPLPTSGTLDLSKIIESRYCFA